MSIEIPDAAVRDAIATFLWLTPIRRRDYPDWDAEDAMRIALQDALPHLIPAITADLRAQLVGTNARDICLNAFDTAHKLDLACEIVAPREDGGAYVVRVWDRKSEAEGDDAPTADEGETE
jgi:hypothetical protein